MALSEQDKKIRAAMSGHGEIFEQQVQTKLHNLLGGMTERKPNGNGKAVEFWYPLQLQSNKRCELFIEVKQAGGGRNVWVFTERTYPPEVCLHVIKVQTNVSREQIVEKHPLARAARICLTHKPIDIVSCPITDAAFEFSEKLLSKDAAEIEKEMSGNYDKEQGKEKQRGIDHIINTACEQLAAVIPQKARIELLKALHNAGIQIFIPIVITNANLRVWDAEHETITDKNWLIYDHPINNTAHYIKEITACGEPLSSLWSPQEHTKLSTFIVNINALPRFVEWLKHAFAGSDIAF